ncbi:BspA family leucine-rich repeat surface protein [Enterococcus hirae]|uniref:BspA family leucine-rich repeat surface protein n=1 Tax=Enterococcus TaxID=1350 RepID=UPI0009C0D24E|nr:BspA family leucine-rich repeat surface protein [Enterococcus hirae]EMF0051986.1 BspA family leucine-rich repeat surface protein [Enterococcus hirae]EMF0093889.1 BspA family leucine-rich repeat surface protein [Enterococcus hirae]EMF0097532.1 BspA family leucine-rich repeat surface protein [Enterococcus hirae]EMF0100513.1 BspA family leucine-rich repeat surface protein [Enterococcus hirae]EMF0123690.1 BspA family leucine-rich repeat surface protein [Enterococcus hirae]
MRKIKYVSIMMILLGNMVYYGQSGFADSQTATTVENNDLKQVVESPTAGSHEGVYQHINYRLNNSELTLSGLSDNTQFPDIVINSSFLDAIQPNIKKLILSPQFLRDINKNEVRSLTVSADLPFTPCIASDHGNSVNLTQVFSGNQTLKNVDFGLTDFSQVVNTSEMFKNCTQLQSVKIHKLDATNLSGMFMNCPDLTQVKILENEMPEDLSDMFNACPQLTKIEGINNWKTTMIKSVKGFVTNCHALKNLDLSHWPVSLQNQLQEQNEHSIEGSYVATSPVDQVTSSVTAATGTVSEWQYQLTPQKDRYLLTKYIGKSQEIVVPTVINGKPTILNNINHAVFPNYKSITSFKIASGNKVPIQTTDLRYAFQFWSNLKEVDLTGLNVSTVTNTGAMFANDPLLTKANLSGWDTSHITDMNYMFNADRNLQELELANWDVRQVMNMSYMFAYLSSLKKLDLSSFQTEKAKFMNSMFLGMNELNLLDLRQFDLTNVTDTTNIFTTDNKTPLLVIAKDNKLLNYNYLSNNRIIAGPTFDANGGTFEDNSITKHYFQSVAVSPTDPKLQMATLDQFKATLVAEKPNSIFIGWNIKEGGSGNQVTDLLNTTYQAIWSPLPEMPSPSDNMRPGTTSSFGLSYIPKKFSFLETPLKESGEQYIPFIKQTSFDVGVCDESQTNNSWSLQAQLVWDSAQEIPTSSIVLTNQGIVKKNINDGNAPFNPSTDLVDCGSEVQGTISPEIKTDSPTVIMKATQAIHTSVYNYDLGNVSLKITDAKVAQPGNYTGHVEWNLVNAP